MFLLHSLKKKKIYLLLYINLQNFPDFYKILQNQFPIILSYKYFSSRFKYLYMRWPI